MTGLKTGSLVLETTALPTVIQHLPNFFKYGPIPASFLFIFVLFTSQINYKLKKA